MLIPSNSPAVDHADASTSLSTDQRGVKRPQGAGFDIGAVEAILTTSWNPSDKATPILLGNDDLTFVLISLARPAHYGVRSLASASSGKKYWELTANAITAAPNSISEGLVTSALAVNGDLGSDLNGIGWRGDGGVIINGSQVAGIQGWQHGDVLSFAVDLDNKKIWFRTNGGNWNNNASNNPATNTGGIDISGLAAGPYFAFGQAFAPLDSLTADFGDSPYANTVPSGFSNW